MERYDAANLSRDEQLKKLDASYLAALNRQVEKAKATGKLDAVIPILDEVQAVKNAADPLPDLPSTASAELKQMRAKHAEARAKILKSHAEAVTSLADKMTAALKAQESELTKAGKIDDALAAKHMRESLEKDEGLIRIRESQILGGSGFKGKPVLQVRRHGDNLEVLVFNDRAGKVSMESPVENTREKTGESKELGDTKATNLGEFVGAKGCKVDPYIFLDESFAQKKTTGVVATQMALKPAFTIDNRKGMRVSFEPDATNPNIFLIKNAPTKSNPGSLRTSVTYYIPKTNQHVKKFVLIQGDAPLGGITFDKLDEWSTMVFESEAQSENQMVQLFFQPLSPAGQPDSTNDFIVLESIKIEQIRFSAFIQRRLGPGGKATEEYTDAAKQPVLISNGALIEP
jgi:hypothetical protein